MQKKLFCFGSLSVFIVMLLVGAVAYAQLESLDIGDAANLPGSTQIEGKKITIKAGGHDIWDDADGFRFVYKKVSGDFEAQVHLISLEIVTEWTKAAIMARQSIAANSEHVIATVTGGGASGSQITWRKAGANDETDDLAPGDWKTTGGWLKLTRKGNQFQGYISEDGKNWLDLGSQTLVMTNPILVGLAVSALSTSRLITAVFEDFRIDGVDVVTAVEPEGKVAVTWGKIKSR